MTKRVYELANEMKLDSKKVLEKMESLGIAAKNHMSVIDDKDVSRVKDELLKGKSKIEEKKTILAPNGKPLPMGKPMPKAAVPQKKADEEQNAEDIKEEVKAEVKVAAPEADKPQEKVAAKAPVKEAEAEKAPVVEKAEKKEEKKPEEPADVFYYDGRPAPQKLKIVKTNAQIVAEEEQRKKEQEALRKKQEEERKAQAAERRPNSQDRGPRQGQGQDRGPRQGQGQDRGPRQGQGQDRGPRQGQGQDRGPRQGQGQGGPRQGQGQGAPRQGQGQGGPRQGQGQGGPRQGQGGRPGQGGQGQGGRPGQGGQGQGGRPGQGGQGQGGRPGQGGQNRGPAKTGSDTATGMEKPSRVKKTKDGKDVKKDQFGKKSTPYKPLDLTKSAPKKHRKRQDKQSDQVEENILELEEMPAGTKIVTVPITVAGLSEQIEKTTSQVIMGLMKLGIMANINQNLDEETVVLLGEQLGVNIVVGKVDEEIVEEGLELFQDKEEDLQPRPPIITVMGHVDHGKTSLLDSIRKTSITDKEAGGITQHIGASEVELDGKKIVFLDTPGHEAFTAMRARGAHVTDIAILVVAADDSVKPQTIESISHAKAAGVPIIVAINKMDKPGANPDRVKQDLTEHGIVVEEWGGDTIAVPVSAKTGDGIVNLLEMILLQAEVLELKANPNRLAMGTVIEARLDKAKGPVSTLLVLNGTLKAGMSVVAGTSSGRIRAMTNFKGDVIEEAGPATAVEILGLTEVPEAGDEFNAVKEDKLAREIAENRRIKLREEVMARNASVTLEQLFSQIEEGEVKELNLIIKADVQGSVGALTSSLEKLKNENVVVKIIHTGVGTVTESDVMLASTSKAIIIGFNVRPSTAVTTMADRDGVEIRTYRIIYEAIEHIEAAMKGMLDPVFKEVVMGKIEVRETFKVPNIGIIAGAYVLEGKVQRNAQVRLVRDGIVVHEGKISSLRRFKDDVREVSAGYECGIGIENYNDLKLGDIIEAFKMEEIERK